MVLNVKRWVRNRMFTCGAGMAVLILGIGVANADVDPSTESNRFIKAHQEIQAMGPTPFGERINMYSGEVSFSQADISLPGIGPDISIVRTTRTSTEGGMLKGDGVPNAAFGSWDLNVPRIETLVTTPSKTVLGSPGQNWQVNTPGTGNAYSRCSYSMMPWNAFSDWWRGINFIGPSGDGQTLMRRAAENTHAPNGQASTYPIVTDQNWQLRCIANTSNGEAGEAYVALAPDGTQYQLDHLTGTRAETIVEYDYSTGGPRPIRINTYRMLARMQVSRATDRFGNWVDYQYSGGKLIRIIASDGREVILNWRTDLPYVDNIVVQPTGNAPRTWRYEYDAAGTLSAVVLPDASRWSFSGNLGPFGQFVGPTDMNACGAGRTGTNGSQQAVANITAPSGLTGTFTLQGVWHGRAYVPSACLYDPSLGQREGNPPLFGTFSLVQRTLSGPGLSPQTWNYAYSAAAGSTVNDACASAGNCSDTAFVDVTEPSGTRARHSFSTRWGVTEGQLLQVQWFNASNQVLKTQSLTYAAYNAGPFPARLGVSHDIDGMVNVDRTERLSPLRSRTITQDGTSFYLHNYSYDAFANPVTVGRWSSLGYSRTEVTEYHHDLSNWVLSQPYRTYNASNGVILSRTEYTAKAQPSQQFAFEKLQSTYTYNSDGTIATVKDGRNNTTTLSNWKRGIPQNISFADGNTKSAVVDDNGWVRSVTDENGYVTGYGYDAMGNIAAINYPQEDNLAYHITTRIFERMTADEYGIAAGHWRERTQTGNAKKLVIYDALLRPVVTQTEDVSNSAGTLSWSFKRYDANGNVVFASYPKNPYVSGWNTVNDTVTGTRTQYDALDRPTRNEQDSELGVLVSLTEYLAGFQVRTTNPRGYQSTNGYQVYDTPNYDMLAWSAQPEGKTVEIGRNFADMPIWIRQRAQDDSVSVTRSYVYDGNLQLCKTVEPETGATVNHYDAAGNIDWSASGLALPDTGNCNTAQAQASGRVVNRVYNSRNRVTGISFPDGRGNQQLSYWPDGLKHTITTYNDPNNGAPVVNQYVYNKRRLLTGESQSQPGWYTWSLGYGYSSNGDLASQSYPDGMVVTYSPNALGQATQVMNTSGQAYATAASYYPNGALKQFTYGNGIVHTMTQNARQLPARSTDVGAINYSFSYDANGNPSAILDDQQGSNYSRWMSYDGLDRLTDAGSCSFGGDCWHRIRYNALDNITSNRLPGVKDYAQYVYDGSNRLTQIKDSAGTAVVNLGYDVQGNLASKTGRTYSFDYGNRLRNTSEGFYRYDAAGRRVLKWPLTESGVLSIYSDGGQVMYDENLRADTRKSSRYVYLAGSLIATRTYGLDSGLIATQYHHTDALGSPVAVSNEAAQVIERTQWEPYGAPVGKPNYDGYGYTGHIMDAATALIYMQQRYYDPAIGRFLSNDPVLANANTGANFNRYWYANNNPYKFVDPDGRATYVLYPLTNPNVNTIVTDGQGGIKLHLGNTRGMGSVVLKGVERHENTHKTIFPTNCENTCGILQGAPEGMGIGILEPSEAAASEVRASNVEINYLREEKNKIRNSAEKPAIEARIQQMTEYRDGNQEIVNSTPPPPPQEPFIPMENR